jgi:hypothetical protein
LERLWCAAGYTYSAELAEKAGREKRKWTFKEIVPEEYWSYAKVFLEVEYLNLNASLNTSPTIMPSISNRKLPKWSDLRIIWCR